MNLLTDLSLFDNLISISWTLLSLPVFYLIVQLLKIYTSVFTKYNLMEYVNLDHPLLKKLKKEAPGTYQHSLAMANLAETAANEIGANGILCRVGAYYHDIGKTVSPNFFTENQQGKSPHSILEPIESATIIMSHVTNGTRLAKEHKLPKYITQFITTHHGTTVLEYFFDKANSTNKIQPNPNDFRYPGDKPTNKETAILMIVDSVEAASRSLDEITKDKLDELISKIVFKKILLNQLSKSTLTLTELRTIVLTLIDSLVNNSHSRIKYPWQKKLEDSQKIITKQIIKEKLPDSLSEDDKEEILKEIIEENSLNSDEIESILVEDTSKDVDVNSELQENSKEIKEELNKPKILED
jgi:putative nucleotidyltransferase with HDIG domain